LLEEAKMTQQLPESPIDGLEVERIDMQYNRTFYKPTIQYVHSMSQYRDNEYSIGSLGWWMLDQATIASLPKMADGTPEQLQTNTWYHFRLATKPKDPGPNTKPGSLHMDIKKVKMATDDEIPAQQPTQAANPPQTGSQSRPDRPVGDFNTGMAFNQACTLVAALITSHPQARDWLDYDYIVEEVQNLRERLYHEVLMLPIGTPDEEPGADYEEPTANQEPEMPESTVAEEPEPDEPF
jgi:hypothetical protein